MRNMSKIVRFEFEHDDEVFFASLTGIRKAVIISATYSTHTERIQYRVDGSTIDEEYLFKSVEDLRKNLKYLGDD